MKVPGDVSCFRDVLEPGIDFNRQQDPGDAFSRLMAYRCTGCDVSTMTARIQQCFGTLVQDPRCVHDLLRGSIIVVFLSCLRGMSSVSFAMIHNAHRGCSSCTMRCQETVLTSFPCGHDACTQHQRATEEIAIELPIPLIQGLSAAAHGATSVSELLAKYQETEQLRARSELRCSVCGEPGVVSRTSRLLGAPDVLLVCLARWAVQRTTDSLPSSGASASHSFSAFPEIGETPAENQHEFHASKLVNSVAADEICVASTRSAPYSISSCNASPASCAFKFR